jgi:hypothetical protein
MSKPDGGPAFPVIETTMLAAGEAQHLGLTIRDWLAGQALIGIAMSGAYSVQRGAQAAYEYADAMLAAKDRS